MTIRFFVPGRPEGKPRPRATKAGHMYTPDGGRRYERRIRDAFREATEDRYALQTAFPAEVPVRLSVTAYHAIPQRESRARQKAMAAGLVPCIRKPDLDNVLKSAADALNGWAYQDDRQIVRVSARRRWTAGVPGIEVEIGEASE